MRSAFARVPSVSHSSGLPRSGRRRGVRPFLDRKLAAGWLLLSGLPGLAGKQLEPRGNSVLKTCFLEQSVEWWLNVWPGRRGPQVIASQKALINQVAQEGHDLGCEVTI